MRRLMYLTLGFGAGCALCACLLPADRIGILCACALALFLITLGLSRGGRTRRAVFLLGLTIGGVWYWGYYRLYLEGAVRMDAKVEQAVVRVSDYGYETDYGSAAECTVTVEGKTYRAKVYLKDSRELIPGDTIEGVFRFRVTTPGGEKPATYHKGRGTFLLLYQKGELTVGHSENRTWMDRIAGLRKGLKDTLTACFPEDTRGFAKALLLGDTGELSYEVDTDLKVSGIRHVAAVSGLHVSMLFVVVEFFTLKRRFLTVLAGLPALLLFAALAGFSPSITRACLMWALMLLAQVWSKSYDSPTALSFAALIMLAVNPLVITDVGFQLSVGSVAGILLFSGRMRTWIMKRFSSLEGKRKTALNGIAASVSITLGAQFFTAPLSALYFGMVSLIGVVTNLLTLWVVGVIFYGILGVCLTYGVWHTGAALLARGISWLIRYVLAVAKILANIPLAAVYTKSPYIVAWLIFVYLLLAVFLARKKRKPEVLTCCAVIGLCAALLCAWAEPMGDDVRFTVLDVGQGQCLILQSEGDTYLVDCGGDRDDEAADLAAEALLSQGIASLDGLILTHCDRDHAGGVEGLLSRVDTDLLILPAETGGRIFHTKGEVVYAAEDLELTFGTGKIRIFAPKYGGDPNENSLCVLFDTEKCDILITGDRDGFGERSLLRNGDIPKVDILVAGHHGSKNSTCQELITAVQPEIVCISVGKDNAFGHPAPETLARLEENGCTVYRTDLNGEIVIRR